MKQLWTLLTASVCFFASSAFALAPVTVACYGDNIQASFIFDQDQTNFTFAYEKNEVETTLIAYPQTTFEKRYSYVRTSERGNRIDLVSQMISGNSETPIFASSATLVLTQDQWGAYTLQTAQVLIHEQAFDFAELIGKNCYVQ